jgi:hypothetical protein
MSQIVAAPRPRIVLVKAGEGGGSMPVKAAEVTGVLFQPFEEVQVQLKEVDTIVERGTSGVSLARMGYEEHLEAAVNEQIK